MNIKPTLRTLAVVGLLLVTINSKVSTASAQGTAFTYQGLLNSGDTPANGSYDIAFTLFATNTSGVAIAGPVTNAGVSTINGLFTTTVDFGSVFTGGSNWLEIAVSTNGANTFLTLSPRQQLAPVPFAEFAISAGNLANGVVVQQNTDGAPNLVGGSPANFIAGGVIGGTIGGGGGTTNIFGISLTNNVTDDFGTVSGGAGNIAGSDATVGGGFQNTALAGATVSGGEYNTASGYSATVPGGANNLASGQYSFAAGYVAEALYDGDFVWSDYSSAENYASTGPNQFCVRATGGVVLAADVSLAGGADYHHLSLSGGNSTGFLYGAYPKWGDGVHLGYNYYSDATKSDFITNPGGGTSRISAGYGEIVLAVGPADTLPYIVRLDATTSGVTVSGTFNTSSDRNAKQDFAPVSASEILEKVLRLPLSEWSYKDDPTTRHLGPMGQDFHSVFNIGTDEKHIAPIDEGGVALAAIQGLNQKLNEKESEIAALKQSVAELKQMVQMIVQEK